MFFVHNLDSHPGFASRRSVDAPARGRRIEVTFLDNEVVVGTTLNYRPDGPGFFVSPADQAANNSRIFVVASAVRRVRFF